MSLVCTRMSVACGFTMNPIIVSFLDNSFYRKETLSFNILITDVDVNEFPLILLCGRVYPIESDTIAVSGSNNFFSTDTRNCSSNLNFLVISQVSASNFSVLRLFS